MTKIKIILLILNVLFSFNLESQTVHGVLSVSGGDASGTGGSIGYSVGQIVYTTNTGTSGSIAQGIEQAYEIYSVGINDSKLTISLSIFPNPTSDFLTLKIQDYLNENLRFQLVDENGKLISNDQITALETQIEMRALARASYFLNILKNNEIMQSFKIIKN
jgi:hypothetical protein